MSDFAPLGTMESIPYGDLVGSLLMFDVHEFIADKETVHGKRDAIRADIAVVDGAQAGRTFPDALVFPAVLVSRLRSALGRATLGRLGQGQASGGKNPPWELYDPTEQDKAAAVQLRASLQLGQAPAPQQQAPPPAQGYAPPPPQQAPPPQPQQQYAAPPPAQQQYAPPPQQQAPTAPPSY